MASTNYTAHYGLNQWVGSDKPKMQDFNADNAKLDSALYAHTSDTTRHISESALESLLQAAPVIGSYEGNGAEDRLIELGFEPSFGLLFANGKNLLSAIGSTGNMMVYSAMLAKGGRSQGVLTNSAGFTVLNLAQTAEGRVAQLNAAGVTYHYLMFR